MRLVLHTFVNPAKTVGREAVAIIDIWEPNEDRIERVSGHISFYGKTPELAAERARGWIDDERRREAEKAANYAAAAEKIRNRKEQADG